MANFDPQQLSEDLKEIGNELVTIADKIDDITDMVLAVQGKAKQLLAPNLESQADQVYAIANGTAQNSISQIRNILENMPLRDLKTVKRGDRSRQQEIIDNDGIPAGQLKPDLSNGPKSQIAQENIRLENYLKGVGKKSSLMEGKVGKAINQLMETEGIGRQTDMGDLFNAKVQVDKTAIREATNTEVDISGITDSDGHLKEGSILNLKMPGASIDDMGMILNDMANSN